MREAGYGFFLPHFLSRLSPSTQEKNTWDDSELEQSGLHSAVRFLSAVLALRASLIPAFFLFFFCLPALLLLFLFFSSEFTFPSGLAVKRTLTRYHSHWKASGTVPLSPPPPSGVVFLHQDLNTQADVITPSPSFLFFFYIFCFWYMLRIFFFLSDRLEDFVFGHGFKLRNPGSYIGKSLW